MPSWPTCSTGSLRFPRSDALRWRRRGRRRRTAGVGGRMPGRTGGPRGGPRGPGGRHRPCREPAAGVERRPRAHPRRRATATAWCGGSRVRREASCVTSIPAGCRNGGTTLRRGRGGRRLSWWPTCGRARRPWRECWPNCRRRLGTRRRAPPRAWSSRRATPSSHAGVRWSCTTATSASGRCPSRRALVEEWLARELPRLGERTDATELLAWIIGRGDAPELRPW